MPKSAAKQPRFRRFLLGKAWSVSKPDTITLPAILLANDLRSGAVVFRTMAGGWSRDASLALVAETRETAERLKAEALAAVSRNEVVDAYLVDIAEGVWPPRPNHFRERRKITGPSAGPHAVLAE